MRSLPRREAIATMALTVVEHLMAQRRYRDALAVADLIARHSPRNGFAWAQQGQAACQIIEADYLARYGSRWLISSHARPGYLLLLQRNQTGFATARRLGWEPVSQPAIWRN